MAKTKNIEKKIWDSEGFDVAIKLNGKDVRSDKVIPSNYDSYERIAKNDMTVSEWKQNRFNKCLPGFDVDVLDADGKPVNGKTKLGTVRDTYNDDV